MAKGGPGQPKGGGKECKVCGHPGRTQIDNMLLSEGASYPTIIATMKRTHPSAVDLSPSNLSRHKTAHLLTQPITVVKETEDGTREVQTYLNGAYPSTKIEIPEENLPDIPALTKILKAVIAAGMHNILHNPSLVTPDKLLVAIDLLRKMGGSGDEFNEFLGSWQGVKNEKDKMTQAATRTRRKVTVEQETVEVQQSAAEQPRVETVEAEWSAADVENLALPAPEADDGV